MAVFSGDWSDASNWSSVTLPNSDDYAYIANGGTASVTQAGTTSGLLFLGESTGAGYVNMTGGQMYVSSEYLGDQGAGSFTQSGGSNNVGNDLILGYTPAGSGAYNLSGGLLTTNFTEVGYASSGAFVQTGGTHSANYLHLATVVGGSSSYNLSSGLLAVNWAYIGTLGTGSFVQSGGSNSIATYLTLGSAVGGNGTYILSGSGRLSADREDVGFFGSGIFLQTGGTDNAGSYFFVGFDSGGSGTYSLGGGLLNAGSEYLANSNYGNGAFQHTGGMNNCLSLTIAKNGSYLLGGGTLQVANIQNQGTFSGGGSASLLAASGILDLTLGTWQNLGTVTLDIGANSLLIVPQGAGTSAFASYSSLGLTHTLGTTLSVPAGRTIVGTGSIVDPIVCQGSILASSGTINLSGGLTLFDHGRHRSSQWDSDDERPFFVAQ